MQGFVKTFTDPATFLGDEVVHQLTSLLLVSSDKGMR